MSTLEPLGDLSRLKNKEGSTAEDDALSTARSDVTEDAVYKTLQMGSRDIWALGITVVIGGQYFSWNVGLEGGFGSYALAFLLISSLYLCLILGNAELCSAFPFTGGAYGLGRLTLGMYWGFVVACCEAMEYILYVSSSALTLANMIVSVLDVDSKYSLLFSLLFYISALVIHIKGGRYFCYTNLMLAIISITILLMYCFGGLNYVNFISDASDPRTTGGTERRYFIGGLYNFMKIYPLAAWFYVGIESLNLATVYVPDARKMIPIGSITCMATLMATGILVLFICSSIAPTLPDDDSVDLIPTAHSVTPFSIVFMRLFRISERLSIIFSIPATYATAYGFIFAYGRLILSMARSSLFPPILKTTYGDYETPYMAFICGSLIGYIVCILVYFFPDMNKHLFSVCMLSGFSEYLSQFIGYLIFRRDHGTQERSFHSPFGVYGAIYGIFVTLIGIIAIIGFQDDNQTAFITFVIALIIMTVYYFTYAKYHQQLSAEEKFVYFKCHVRKFNARKANALIMKKPSMKFSHHASEVDPVGQLVRGVSKKMSLITRQSSSKILASVLNEDDKGNKARSYSTEKIGTMTIPVHSRGSLTKSSSEKFNGLEKSNSKRMLYSRDEQKSSVSDNKSIEINRNIIDGGGDNNQRDRIRNFHSVTDETDEGDAGYVREIGVNKSFTSSVGMRQGKLYEEKE